MIFLLLAAGAFAFAQRAGIQERPVLLNEAVGEAAVWLGAHLAKETTTVLFNFSAPTRELSNYCSDWFIDGIKAMGAGSVVQIDGDLVSTDARDISNTIGCETNIMGSFQLREDGGLLALRSTDARTGEVLGNYRALIRPDQTLRRLLAGSPAAEPPSYAPLPKPAGREAEFTPGRRAAAAAANLLLGLGSYTMGDWVGGLIVTGGYGLAAGLFIGEAALDIDDPAHLVPAYIGVGVAGATILFGILRPLFYHSYYLPGRTRRYSKVLDGANIAIIPQASGIKAVQLSYRFQF
jgi:hypothetical protein